jgi:UDP-N-acetylmuramyl pentapeptide phosphotransferase/UDP-N-acetylglucosamine-1-phosphate transferase
LITVAAALGVVANRNNLTRIMRERGDTLAVQSSHTGNPLRLGGIAIFAGLVAGIAAGVWYDSMVPVLLLVSAVPALLAGLWEDLGYGASAGRRLAAAFASAALATVLLGAWVSRANLPILDDIMIVAPLGLLLTTIISAGFCHATNLIDGMNGLAAVFVTSAAAALALLAHDADQSDLALAAAILGAAMAGFFLLNWPFGTIFLGDAGSYGVGHVLIWIAILLAARAPDIAVPALVLILFWPFADTVHTVARRLVSRSPVFEPDRMHLHQKMRRCIEIVLLGDAHRKRSNPMATLALAPMVMAPIIAGVMLADDARAAWAALCVFAVLFALTNVAITRLAIRRRRKTRYPERGNAARAQDEEYASPVSQY